MIQFSLTLSGSQLALMRDIRDGKAVSASAFHSRYFLNSMRVLERENLILWADREKTCPIG